MDYNEFNKGCFEEAKRLYKTANQQERNILEKLFPELKNKDEKVRQTLVKQTLIDLVKCNERSGYKLLNNIPTSDMIDWLEKQGEQKSNPCDGCVNRKGCINCENGELRETEQKLETKWNKNTEYNKPQVNHSVLMYTTHGIAEGEWKGDWWYQYRWSATVYDREVIAWMELTDLEKQNERKCSMWVSVEDRLPDIDREVIALVYEHEHYKVVFAHRPAEYWDGTNILTGEVSRYVPKTYDNGMWNIPNVKWWLDLELPD